MRNKDKEQELEWRTEYVVADVGKWRSGSNNRWCVVMLIGEKEMFDKK